MYMAEVETILNNINVLYKRKSNMDQLITKMAPKKYTSITDFILDDNPHKLEKNEINMDKTYEHLYLHGIGWVCTSKLKT